MTWLKLDDGWQSHPKMQRIGPMGRELWLAGALHCARHLTDGMIEKHMVPVLAAYAGVKPSVTKQLIEVGVWHDCGDCYEIHDFLKYQRSREDVERERDKYGRSKSLHDDRGLIEAVRQRDGDRCRYCALTVNWVDRRGKGGGTYDHVDPDAHNSLDNVVVACRGCNAKKGHRTPGAAGMVLLEPTAHQMLAAEIALQASDGDGQYPSTTRPVPSLSVTTPPTTTTSLAREVVVVLEAICYVETAGAMASGKVDHPERYRRAALEAMTAERGRTISQAWCWDQTPYELAAIALADHPQLNAILVRIADTEDSCSTSKHDDSALDSRPSGPTDDGAPSTNGDSSSSSSTPDSPTALSIVSATPIESSRPSRSGARRTAVSPEAKPKRPSPRSGKDRPMPLEQSSPESKPTSKPEPVLSGPAFLGAQLGKKGRPRNELDDLVRGWGEEDRLEALSAWREQIPERRQLDGQTYQVDHVREDGQVFTVKVTNGLVGGFRADFPAATWKTMAVIEP